MVQSSTNVNNSVYHFIFHLLSMCWALGTRLSHLILMENLPVMALLYMKLQNWIDLPEAARYLSGSTELWT